MKINFSTKKTFSIAIMTGSFHTDYSRMIVDAFCEQLKEENIQIYLFQGFDATRYLSLNAYVDDSFDRHYYSIFEYSNFLKPDLLIVSFGTISAVPSPLSLQSFLKGMPQMPVIVLEDDSKIENGISVTVDNYGGMKACVEHLIHEHGCTKIVYVSGPENVSDSKLRLKGYQDAMRENGLAVGQEQIVYGDFTDQVDSIVRELLHYVPDADAIVCANDEMAESAYRVIREKGLLPGKDILVTGFDDNDFAKMMNPALTTVRQDFLEVSSMAAKKVSDLINGEKIESEIIPAKLIVRGSCGCKGNTDDGSGVLEEEQTNKAYREHSKVKNLQSENIISSLILRGILTRGIKTKDFFDRLGRILNQIGTRRSYIALLPEPLPVSHTSQLFLPESIRLYMKQVDEDVISYDHADAPTVLRGQMQQVMGERGIVHKQMAVFPLFSGEYHFGVFFVELSRESMLFYYTLSLEIGTGISYLLLTLEEEKAHLELEEKNRQLDYSATHDALTGLYNRFGTIENAEALIAEGTDTEVYAALMADLDHLKQINDTLGHEAGDTAIKRTAEILRKVLPKEAVIGRIGGDEFECVVKMKGGDPENFAVQIRKMCDEYNEMTDNPYYLGISVGYALFSPKDTVLSDAMKKADEKLYQAKQSRRKNVIR